MAYYPYQKFEKNYVDVENLSEIIYWTKKWEISPKQLLKAMLETKSNSIIKIRKYLVNQGFAI